MVALEGDEFAVQDTGTSWRGQYQPKVLELHPEQDAETPDATSLL
jgi:hypothetical protein